MKAKHRAGRSGEPRLKTCLGLSLSGFHKLAYWEWGPENAARTAVCLHGLTRQGRDFDFLAARLVEQGYRVGHPHQYEGTPSSRMHAKIVILGFQSEYLAADPRRQSA